MSLIGEIGWITDAEFVNTLDDEQGAPRFSLRFPIRSCRMWHEGHDLG